MKKDTSKELKKIIEFIGLEVSEEHIEDAIEYSSFDNMKKIESNNTYNNRKLQPGDVNDPESFK